MEGKKHEKDMLTQQIKLSPIISKQAERHFKIRKHEIRYQN